MKRRDFVKAGICLGGAGAIASVIPLMKKEGITSLSDIEIFLKERKFFFKNEKELPKELKLDICNLCQLNCVECVIRKNEEAIKKAGGFGYISFETFKNLIDRYPFLSIFELSNHGEIFLNPELEDIVKYAYEKYIVLTARNGVNLNTISERMIEALVKYQFRQITVSIDGATPETYAIYRRGGDFNTVINNIKLINKYKEKYNSPYPILDYKYILFGHNEHEIEKAKMLADKLNMNILFEVNYAPDYSPVINKEKVLQQTGLLTLESHLNQYYELYKTKQTWWFFCVNLFTYPQFDYNGDLLGCCLNLTENFGTNLFKDGLLNSLNNAKVLYAKLMLTDLDVTPDKSVPCCNCDIYKLLKSENYPIRLT